MIVPMIYSRWGGGAYVVSLEEDEVETIFPFQIFKVV
jgi:hypothetical protein